MSLLTLFQKNQTLIKKVVFGDNCFILENQNIQNGVKIGNNVTIWSGNHIGHNSLIDDHTYLSSHVVISGHCNIGKDVFLELIQVLLIFVK